MGAFVQSSVNEAILSEQIKRHLEMAGAGKNEFYLTHLLSLAETAELHKRGDLATALTVAAAAMGLGDLDSIQKRITSLSANPTDANPLKSLMMTAGTRYEEMIKNKGKLGVPTGFEEFDADSGGLKAKQMTVLAGETNAGKSTVALNLVHAAVTSGHPTALFTLEMDRDEIVDFMISRNCGVNRNRFNTGYFNDEDLAKIAEATMRLCNAPLWIDDAPTLTCAEIRTRTMALKAERDIALVVVDYAQIVSPDDPREPREQQVAKVARALRALAKEASVPVFVLSQLNDEGKLRESRVLAHEAHNVLQVEADADDTTKLMLKVYKGRRIPKKNYQLAYAPEYCRVTNQVRPNETNPRWRQP